MLEKLKERVKEIEVYLEQSAANHNSLIGRLAEAKLLLDKFLQDSQKIDEKQEVIENDLC